MHPIDLTIIVLYLILMSVVGWWVAKKASRNAESYFLASKSLPWWIIGVAHGSSGLDITGHDVVRDDALRLRSQGDVAALGLAAVQRHLPDDVPGDVGPAVERLDRGRVDADPVRQQPRGRAGVPQRRGLCPGERRRVPQLCVPRHRQVHTAVLPVGSARWGVRLGDAPDHGDLLRGRRHVQRDHERPDPVRPQARRGHRGRGDRDLADQPRADRRLRAAGLGSPLLRLEARPGLVAD